jgi:protease IV
MPPPPMPSRRCRHWPFWTAIVALVATLSLSLLLNVTAVGMLAGGGVLDGDGWGVDEFPQFTETHSYGNGETKVARIGFFGIMTRELDGGWLGTTDPVEEAIRQIRAARQDEEVEAILLQIDSPGGGVTCADEIHRELMLFKQSREGRKIVALVHDMAASGGYYVAVPADHIVAQPTALLGSIGVILQTINVQGLSEKIGVTDTTIKSGRNKDMLNPFQPVDPEQVRLLQESIDAMHERFVELVAEGRSLPKETVQPLADGRIFTAQEALANKLVDSIGYWEDALAATAGLLGVEDIYVVSYSAEQTFFDLLVGARTPLGRLHSLLSGAVTPRRQYLWRP